MFNTEEFNKIKKLAIVGLFSDPFFLEKLTLAGGNCISIGYEKDTRASLDVDFFMKDDFEENDLGIIRNKIEINFKKTFSAADYYVFDIMFGKKPKTQEGNKRHKWGGYELTFKLISKEKFLALEKNIEKCRREALFLGKGKRGPGKTFKVDISKHEYCEVKDAIEINGILVYIATPSVIIISKLRALCQRMKEYQYNSRKKDLPRARDFYDIFIVNEHISRINFEEGDDLQILKEIFRVKEVPLELLKKIKEKREVHRDDFRSVKDAITGESESFDFYFDYVINLVEKLEYIGMI